MWRLPVKWDTEAVAGLVEKRKEEILIMEKEYKQAFGAKGPGEGPFILRGVRYVYRGGYEESEWTVQEKLKKIWGSEPIMTKSLRDVKKILTKEMDRGEEHDFTVVIPINEKALWMRDVEDHLVDDPIPVPSRKQRLLMACRLSNNSGKAREYRKDLKERDLEEIKQKAFEVCMGFYTRNAPLQYGIFLAKTA